MKKIKREKQEKSHDKLVFVHVCLCTFVPIKSNLVVSYCSF